MYPGNEESYDLLDSPQRAVESANTDTIKCAGLKIERTFLIIVSYDVTGKFVS